MVEVAVHFSPRCGSRAPHVTRLHEADNVAVAINAVGAGVSLSSFQVATVDAIPQGHKIALRPIGAGEAVIKYGQIIGNASQTIAPGRHVHTHNLSMAEFDRDYAHGRDARAPDRAAKADRPTFLGFRRADGRCATRNYIGIVTSVNCSASAARMIAQEAERSGLLADFPNVDGIVPIAHGAGCGINPDNESFAKLQRAIWGTAMHPNFAGVLMVGLGCETNQISSMLDKYGTPDETRFSHFSMQQVGGTRKTVAEGLRRLQPLLERADAAQREAVGLEHLVVALQCGGSDGLSGITANPALGRAVDMLVARGGSAALAETPEIYGAEHLLTRRAASPEVGEALVALIKWWEEYAAQHDASMDNNPSPGNKRGGLTTILEKSLGAVAKAGSTNLMGVYGYGEPITARGLVFMDSPGYDPMSITGQVASGCNLVCFTTGRGSCFGSKPAPTIKIATNTSMFERMRGDMDINCGTIADGDESVDEAGARIFAEMLEVASGKRSVSEQLGIGDAEFVPWQTYAQM